MTTITNRVADFRSTKIAIGNAQKHILNLEREISTFLNQDDVYSGRTDINPENGNEVFKYVMTKDFPDSFFGIAADAFGNLREVLDLSNSSVGRSVGLSKTKMRKLAFPFAEEASALEDTIKRTCKGLPEEIKEVYRLSKPYKGGDDALFALNAIARRKKHLDLVPVGTAATFGPSQMTISGSESEIILCRQPWDSIKQELIVWEAGPGNKFEYNGEVSFQVVIREIESIGEKPVIGLLNHLLDRTINIVEATKATCRSLGIIVK